LYYTFRSDSEFWLNPLFNIKRLEHIGHRWPDNHRHQKAQWVAHELNTARNTLMRRMNTGQQDETGTIVPVHHYFVLIVKNGRRIPLMWRHCTFRSHGSWSPYHIKIVVQYNIFEYLGGKYSWAVQTTAVLSAKQKNNDGWRHSKFNCFKCHCTGSHCLFLSFISMNGASSITSRWKSGFPSDSSRLSPANYFSGTWSFRRNLPKNSRSTVFSVKANGAELVFSNLVAGSIMLFTGRSHTFCCFVVR